MVNRDMNRSGSWDLKEVDSLPQSPCVDSFNLWPDGSCRFVYSGDSQQALRHCSGWAMRNTNNHNVAILKKSCLGVLICSRRCYRPTTGDIVSVRPAICDKARRKQIGKPCPNPDCSGSLILQPCRGHGGYPVTHFWRHANNRIYFMAKGKHDHQRPELKISSDKTRTYTKTEGTTRRKRQLPLKLLASNVVDDHNGVCSCPPFECLCGTGSGSGGGTTASAVAAPAAGTLGSYMGGGRSNYDSKPLVLGGGASSSSSSACQPRDLSPFASSSLTMQHGVSGAGSGGSSSSGASAFCQSLPPSSAAAVMAAVHQRHSNYPSYGGSSGIAVNGGGRSGDGSGAAPAGLLLSASLHHDNGGGIGNGMPLPPPPPLRSMPYEQVSQLRHAAYSANDGGLGCFLPPSGSGLSAVRFIDGGMDDNDDDAMSYGLDMDTYDMRQAPSLMAQHFFHQQPHHRRQQPQLSPLQYAALTSGRLAYPVHHQQQQQQQHSESSLQQHHQHGYRRYQQQQLQLQPLSPPLHLHQQQQQHHDLPGLSVPRLVPPMSDIRAATQSMCIDYAALHSQPGNAVDLTTPKFDYTSSTLAESDMQVEAGMQQQQPLLLQRQRQAAQQASSLSSSPSGSPQGRATAADEARSADKAAIDVGGRAVDAPSAGYVVHHHQQQHQLHQHQLHQHQLHRQASVSMPATHEASSPRMLSSSVVAAGCGSASADDLNAESSGIDFEMNGIQDILDLENFSMFGMASGLLLPGRRSPAAAAAVSALPGLSAFFDKGAAAAATAAAGSGSDKHQQQAAVAAAIKSPPPLRHSGSSSPMPTYVSLHPRDQFAVPETPPPQPMGYGMAPPGSSPSHLGGGSGSVPRSLPNFATVFQSNTSIKM